MISRNPLHSLQMKDRTLDNAHSLREFGLQTALTLTRSIRHTDPQHQDEIAALAARLQYCNQSQNTWIGSDMHSAETGELFEGFGRYWHCYSKLCPYCLRLQAKRNRKKLRSAIESQRLLVGQHYRFITLTIPNVGRDIITTRNLVNRAWTLFRKREAVFGCVVGGAKAEEFTRTSTGFHYHLHLLTVSRFIHKDVLRATWTDCVRKSFAEAGVEFDCPTVDGLLFTNIKIVHDLKQVINEVCKYITKSSTWHEIPPENLCEIALVPRWSRMFEMFGSFRDISAPVPVVVEDGVSDGMLFALGNRPEPTTENTRNYWRKTLAQMTLPQYLKRLKYEVRDTQQRRHSILQLKFPFAVITRLDDS